MNFNLISKPTVCLLNRVSRKIRNLSIDTFPNYASRISMIRNFSTTHRLLQEKQNTEPQYQVTFIKKSGERVTAKGKAGDSLLDVIINNNLDFDGYGACEGTITCSTCHVILNQEDFDRLPDKAGDEELDMLDLAYELTDTSRLGCQIFLSKDLDGLEVRLPSSINDARS